MRLVYLPSVGLRDPSVQINIQYVYDWAQGHTTERCLSDLTPQKVYTYIAIHLKYPVSATLLYINTSMYVL